jgi:hypothetical protein
MLEMESHECDSYLTACKVRDYLCSLLQGQLGTYTYPNGFVDTAIAIGNKPDTVKVKGLECIVNLIGDTQRRWETSEGYTEEVKWYFYLIDHDKGRNLPASVRILDKALLKASKTYRPANADFNNPYLIYCFSHYQII